MKFRKLLTLFIIIAVIAFNGIVSANGLFDVQIGELSAKYSTLATPASYAFGIWSVIYLGLVAYGISLFFKEAETELHRQIQQLLWVNLILNALWLVAFHAEILWLSVITMLVLLATLIAILNSIYSSEVKINNWLTYVFEIYAGWISVATLVNLSLFLEHELQFTIPLEQQLWLLFTILVAFSLVAGIIHVKKGKVSLFSLVLIWAFIAIHCKHKSDGFMYSFFPLLPLLIVVPDFILRLVKDLRLYSSNS